MSVLVQAPTKVVKVTPGTKAVKVAATGPQGAPGTWTALFNTGHVGPPTTGDWEAGQLAVDSNNVVWLCTASGISGTWMVAQSATFAGIAIKRASVAVNSPDTRNDSPTYAGEYQQRQALKIPFNTTRWRLRLSNRSLSIGGLAGGNSGLLIHSAAIGPATFDGTGIWTADFVSAATTFLVPANAFAPPADGTDYIGPWQTTPLLADTSYTLSIGWSSAGTLAHLWTGSQKGFASAAAGCSLTAGSTVAPTPFGGGIAAAFAFMDVRIEYEYLQTSPDQLVGLFVGDSVTVGWGDNPGMSTHEAFPGAAGGRAHFASLNGGVSGETSAGWASLTNFKYTRFDLATTVPDFAVILLGINDINGAVNLATFQANILAIIANLRTLGIKRIYLCTVIPADYAGGGASETLRLSYNVWIRMAPADTVVLDMDRLIVSTAAANISDSLLIGSDNVHPNRGGQQRLASLVAPTSV